MSRYVSLPMYDFVEVQPSTSALLEAIAREVSELGEDVVVGNPNRSEHESLLSSWMGTEMYLSQSCGQPFIRELGDAVDVLGTFVWNGISDHLGNYQTHILVRGDYRATMVSELRGARPVINSPQSLSGWCSLGCALAEVTEDRDFVQPYLISHHHWRSLQLLQDGAADVASVDSATFQILRRHRPALVHGLRIIGSGPLIPATPIIVSKTRNASIDELRALLHRVVESDALATAKHEIGIVGFVDQDRSDFEMIHDLMIRAELVLPHIE